MYIEDRVRNEISASVGAHSGNNTRYATPLRFAQAAQFSLIQRIRGYALTRTSKPRLMGNLEGCLAVYMPVTALARQDAGEAGASFFRFRQPG
jgi:hypothetical protein